MTTEVVLTGTGVPRAEPGRAGPGVLVRTGDVALQFDAGRATVLRLAEAGTGAPEIDAVFVTHHHSDHLTGLVDLVFTRWLERHADADPLTVVAPTGAATRYVERMLDPWTDDIEVRMSHIGRTDRPEPELIGFEAPTDGPVEVWRRDGVRVLAAAVRHEPVLPAVAYRVETPDGAVVVSGDTIVCEEVASLSEGADVLVHEAFRRDLLAGFVDLVPHIGLLAGYHADTVELGALAERIGVPTLVLTHLIPQPPPDSEIEAGFVDDVRKGGYTGTVVVGRDLTTVPLRGGS